jgi:hypothetical protein
MFGDLIVLAIIVLPIVMTFALLRMSPLRLEIATDAIQELAALV